MSEPPETIYLQWYDDEGEASEEITWCQDKINDTDICYRRVPQTNDPVHCKECVHWILWSDDPQFKDAHYCGYLDKYSCALSGFRLHRRQEAMNKTQFRFASEILEKAADEFSNHICNDYEILNTPENFLFMLEMIADSDYPDDQPNLSDDETIIYTMDWKIARYLSRLLKKENGEKKEKKND